MPLSREQLQAFAAVARAGSFTRAAKALHLSQPALSRRISSLEEELETSLLVRGRSGVSLTEPGRRLLDFVEAERALEDELLGDLKSSPATYRGLVRFAGLSSLLPPVVLPALAPFLREHPALQIEIRREVERKVTHALAEGRIDFAISQDPSDVPSIVDVRLGDEEFVMVESRIHKGRRDVFLDVDAGDNTTVLFFAAQPARCRPPAHWTRSYMHDEPGILLAVKLGLGRAVKPRHTLPRDGTVRVDPTFIPMKKPVFLQYRRQRYYGRLHQQISRLVEVAVGEHLSRRSKRARQSVDDA